MSTKSSDIAAQIKALQVELAAASRIEFTAGAKALFAAHPRLKSFGLEAYTPFFNDGDTCVFRALTSYPIINGHNMNRGLEDGDLNGDDLVSLANDYDYVKGKQVSKAHDADAKTIVTAVKDFLKSFDNETYLATFGDHVKITVTENGVETEEFEHD